MAFICAACLGMFIRPFVIEINMEAIRVAPGWCDEAWPPFIYLHLKTLLPPLFWPAVANSAAVGTVLCLVCHCVLLLLCFFLYGLDVPLCWLLRLSTTALLVWQLLASFTHKTCLSLWCQSVAMSVIVTFSRVVQSHPQLHIRFWADETWQKPNSNP